MTSNTSSRLHRLSQDENALEDPRTTWTTARCNRLLRSLTSRLAALRKYRREHSASSTAAPHSKNSNNAQQSPANQAQVTAQPRRRKSDGNDPDWVPLSARKKPPKRKYASRAIALPEKAREKVPTRKQEEVSRPGEICVPTPVIARHERMGETSGRQYSGNCQESGADQGLLSSSVWSTEGPKKPKPGLRGRLENVQRIIKETDEALMSGLCDSFGKLLLATNRTARNSKPFTPRTGSRSLLSTCLRQVPSYIALEEYWQFKDDDNENTDISNEVYQDLEQLGAAAGQGWQGLREVVRAHGAALVAKAASERLLSSEWVQMFVQQCNAHRAYEEAEQLLSAFVLASAPLPCPPKLDFGFDSLLPSYTVEYPSFLIFDFATLTNRRGSLYRLLARMLRSGQLPLEWLSTKQFQPWWTCIIEDLRAKGDDYPYAAELLRTVLLASCQLLDRLSEFGKDDICAAKDEFDKGEQCGSGKLSDTADTKTTAASTNTVSSIMTILTTVTMVTARREDDLSNGSLVPLLWPLESIAVDILTAHSSILEDQVSLLRATTVLASLLLLRATKCKLPEPLVSVNIDTIVRAMDRISHSAATDTFSPLQSIPSFVCSTAHCLGRSRGTKAYVELQLIVPTLTDFDHNLIHVSSPARWFMRRLGLDSALEFAQSTKKPEHFILARAIEHSMREASAPKLIEMESPFKRVAGSARKGGWRWEEGISEWVAMTPAPLLEARLPVQAPITLPSPVSDAERISPMVVIRRRLLGLGVDGTHETPSKPSLSRMVLGSSPIDAIINFPRTLVDSTHALAEQLEWRRLKRTLQPDPENLAFDPAPKRRRGRLLPQPQRLADITNTISPPDVRSKSTTPSSEADSDAPVPTRTRKAQKAIRTISKGPVVSANDEDELSLSETQLPCAKENRAVCGKTDAHVKKRHNLRRSASLRSTSKAHDAVRLEVNESEDELSFG